GGDLVLESASLAHQLRTTRGETTQDPRLLVCLPDSRQQPGREQLCKRARVEAIRLHLRVADRPHLQRIRDHHLSDVRGQDPRDRERVPGRLERDPIVTAEAASEQLQLARARPDPPGRASLSPVRDRHLAEVAMDVQTDETHQRLPSLEQHPGDATGERQLRIRAHGTAGSVAGAATYVNRLTAQEASRPAQSAFSHQSPSTRRLPTLPAPTDKQATTPPADFHTGMNVKPRADLLGCLYSDSGWERGEMDGYLTCFLPR